MPDRTTWEPAYYDDRLEFVMLAHSATVNDSDCMDIVNAGLAGIVESQLPVVNQLAVVFRLQWPSGEPPETLPFRLGVVSPGGTDPVWCETQVLTPSVSRRHFCWLNIPVEFTEPGDHSIVLALDGRVAAKARLHVADGRVPDIPDFPPGA